MPPRREPFSLSGSGRAAQERRHHRCRDHNSSHHLLLPLWPTPPALLARLCGFRGFRGFRALTHLPPFFTRPLPHLVAFFAVFAGTDGGDGTVTFPDPLNVALDGAPKIAGCGKGAALHDASVTHGGDPTKGATHGETLVHSCASYTSAELSKSCGA